MYLMRRSEKFLYVQPLVCLSKQHTVFMKYCQYAILIMLALKLRYLCVASSTRKASCGRWEHGFSAAFPASQAYE
eukprot:IDg9145t1